MNYKQAAIYSAAREKRERQARIDKQMCKPGYTYNETIKKCVVNVPISFDIDGNGGGNGGMGGNKGGNRGNRGGKGQNSANKAIKMEAAMRKSQGLDQMQ